MPRDTQVSHERVRDVIRVINSFAFSLRNRIIKRIYDYFKTHNLPIEDLEHITEMSRQRMHQIMEKDE